jgi:hypothetical protein
MNDGKQERMPNDRSIRKSFWRVIGGFDMREKKDLGLIFLVTAALFFAGCSMRSLIGAKGDIANDAASRDLPAQREFRVIGNPIIDQNFNFTSDPAATVIVNPATGEETLVLVTSSDYASNGGANFKMDKTYLYTTTDDHLHGSISDPGKWFGPEEPILKEEDFPWLKGQTPKRLYAPDILSVPGYGYNPDRLMIYVPDFIAQANNGSNDPEGKLRIGMAWTNSDSGALYNQFTPMPDFFTIKDGDKPVPNGGYAYDPGIFMDDDTGDFYMVYCDTKAECYYKNSKTNPFGTLGMVKVNKDTMNEGTYLGPITFNNPNDFKDYNGLNLNTMYEEGPDINIMTLPNGEKAYYLIFAAKVVADEDEYIGYATKSVDEFRASKTDNWNFQGWLFKDEGDKGWTNHADFAQYRGRAYVFFHKILPGNTARSACVKEIELRDDRKIVGVERNNYDALDFMGSSIGRGFFYVRDDQPLNKNLTRIHISYLTNKGYDAVTTFTLRYYLNIEDGENLIIDNVSVKNSPVELEGTSLEHIRSKTWSVNLRFKGMLDRGQSIGDIAFDLHYASGNAFTKSNDFSQPYYYNKNAYNLWSDRMGLFTGNGQDVLVCGTVPYVAPADKINDTRILRIDDPNGTSNPITLTCSTQNANDGIKAQNLNTGWTSQEWYLEPATDKFTNPNYVRIKNLWSNKYMTLNNELQSGYYYKILSQDLNKSWNSQIWYIDQAFSRPTKGGTLIPNRYTLRSMAIPQDGNLKGQNIFLTLSNSWKEGYFYPVYGQPRGVDNSSGYYWNTQHWMIQEDYYTPGSY